MTSRRLKIRAALDAPTRGATIAAKKNFPIGTTVDFYDDAFRQRLGKVIGHRAGKVVIQSPPHSRASGISKKMWGQLATNYRIEPSNVRLVA